MAKVNFHNVSKEEEALLLESKDLIAIGKLLQIKKKDKQLLYYLEDMVKLF